GRDGRASASSARSWAARTSSLEPRVTARPERSGPGLPFAVLVLFGINVLNFYDRHVPGALVEPIRREFQLSDAQNGLPASPVIWVYGLVGLPFGRLADAWSRKKVLAGAVVLWSSLTALAGLATSYAVLLVSRLGVGIGEAACAPIATSW